MNRKWLLCAALTALLLAVAVTGCAVGVGDIVTFGRYEQDNDLTNGQEPIEWRVLLIEGDGAQMISVYALDAQPYNEKPAVARWTECTLRTWLNTDFYDTAFDDEEKAVIVTKEIENWKEDPTSDPVYLLSCDEAKQLFANHEDRMVSPTPYCLAQGVYQSTKYPLKKPKDMPGNSQWWLRTHSWEDKYRAAYVAGSGGVMTCGGNSDGRVENTRWAVRPAIYVSIDALTKSGATLVAAQ